MCEVSSLQEREMSFNWKQLPGLLTLLLIFVYTFRLVGSYRIIGWYE